MALEHKLELKLSQRLVLTPQLQQAIKLLQMPLLELSQTLSQELVENPFLEEIADETTKEELTSEEINSIEQEQETDYSGFPLERMMSSSSSFDVDAYFDERASDGRDLGYFNPGKETQMSFEQIATKSSDIYDYLTWQLGLSTASENIKTICEAIIGSIDENGYLTATNDEIAKISEADTSAIEEAIKIVQNFDPPGICARDIKECLLIQIKMIGLENSLAEKIIINDIDDLRKKNYAQIARSHSAPMEEVMTAVKVIEGLEPKPARNHSPANVDYIIPDVFLIKTDDAYQIILNEDRLPKLRINNYYKKLFQQKNTFSKNEKQFLDEKFRSASWLLKSLDQRNRTIYRVTESILNFQGDFFDKGVQHLKPLNLRNIALDLGLHESTISRVTSNKYLSCNRGIFCLKFFFSSALQGQLGEVSSTKVKDLIRTIVIEEDHCNPLSDQRISDMLHGNNITIARRTVAKYREELKIQPQNLRRKVS
jgi:RNA polymerase sigma-54 factor